MLSVGGMQLFRTESYERAENVVPRATQLAGGIGLIYTRSDSPMGDHAEPCRE
jgi:trk system potassium uptake protein TrkH